MLRWLRARWQAMVQQAYWQELKRLMAEGQRLKAEWRATHGNEPIRITASDRRRLDELAEKLSPEWVKRHSIFTDAEVVEDDELE